MRERKRDQTRGIAENVEGEVQVFQLDHGGRGRGRERERFDQN